LCGFGEPLRMMYVVRVGVFKSAAVCDDGLEQVTGFPMAGDMIGLDAIDTGRHPSSVVALEDSEVLALPFARWERWSQESADARRIVLHALAREVVRGQQMAVALGSMDPDQRLARFLLDTSERYGCLGYSRTRFRLRMTRQDIGSYLGLTLETVSRLLSRFRREGFIEVQCRAIALVDLPALRRIGGLLANRQPLRRQDPSSTAGWAAEGH